MPRIDWRAVGAGAALALAVLAVTMVAVQVVDATVGLDRNSNLVFVFYAVALAGSAAGGWLAASRRPDATLVHGLLAALVAYAVVALFGAGLRLTVDKGPDPVALAFNALTAAAAAILGTLVAERWPRRADPPVPPVPDGAMSVLVVDVGTSGVRAAVVGPDAAVLALHHREVLPTSPMPMFVEFDAVAMADAVLDVASAALEAAGPVDAVGIANQRSSTILWERETGTPVGPGISWQDLRTAGMCLGLQASGLRLAPNESATKLAFLLDMADPTRERDLCFGTVDTWVAWTLSGGTVHVTDPTNAALTGLFDLDGSGWNLSVAERLRIPASVLPTIVDSSGVVGAASVLAGSPPIAGLAGDQQASLLGQGCVRPGMAKMTFGTGGMLDLNLGSERPSFARLGPAGTFPIVAWRLGGSLTWGLEAAMLSAGQAVGWLRDDLGVIDDVAQSSTVAAQCRDSGGVAFVPALQGLGAPVWDFGARGALLGLARGAGRPEIVRAVLEGVAHRATDLVEAAEADGSVSIGDLRVDGGMSANEVFVQALADSSQRPVAVSQVLEATTLGAAYLAGLAVGVWSDLDECASLWSPGRTVSPARRLDRAKWRDARDRSLKWVPELSALEFF